MSISKSSLKSDSAREDVLDTVLRYYNRPDRRAIPKYLKICQAFQDAIDCGDLAPEAQLPPELDIAKSLGVSLGTTQRALGHLAGDGLIHRRQGHGTFVAEIRIPEEELWQFRFMRDVSDSKYLPVFATLRRLCLDRSEGTWTTALGIDPAGYVFIERLIHSEADILCLSRMYLAAGKFGRLLDARVLGVNPLNIKLILRTEFGRLTASAEQVVRLVSLGTDDAVALGCEAGDTAIEFVATGIDQYGIPSFYHKIIVGQSDYALDLTFSGTPGRAGAACP